MVWSWDNIGSRFRNNFPSFVHVSLIVLKLSKDESICFFYFFGLVYFTSLKGLWLICSLLIWCYLGPKLETINIIDLKVSLSTMIKVFDCVDHIKLWKILQEMEYQTTWPASWEICMQVKKQKLELDMEQQTCSKSGKESIRVVYCILYIVTLLM